MKIKITNVEYFSDGTTTVVCKISVATNNLLIETDFNDMEVKAEGKAKVSGGDTFNLETGKHLAFSRAKVAAMQQIKNNLVKMETAEKQIVDSLGNAISKVKGAISGEKARLSKTIEEMVAAE